MGHCQKNLFNLLFNGVYRVYYSQIMTQYRHFYAIPSLNKCKTPQFVLF